MHRYDSKLHYHPANTCRTLGLFSVIVLTAVAENSVSPALAVDDECASSDSCATNALQLNANGRSSWGSCKQFNCRNYYVKWQPCQCNSECEKHHSCCWDYHKTCLAQQASSKDCCGGCNGGFCSPVSGSCHSHKSKPYYKSCSAPTVAPTSAPIPETTLPPPPAAVEEKTSTLSAAAETSEPEPAAETSEGSSAVAAGDVAPGVGDVDIAGLSWTGLDDSLNKPSSAPLLTFYVYRAVSNEVYPPLNTNVGSLAGVLWYLHHEVVVQAPRKFNVERILRYKVQMRATEPLLRLGMNYGVRLAFDKGQATGPFVCGRNKAGSSYSPKFCGLANGGKTGFDFEAKSVHMKPYKDIFEFSAYGYAVGCNNLGEYPFPMYPVYYPDAVWYSVPGICPEKLYNDKTDCKDTRPGGYCPGVTPTGNGTCTWNYEPAGEIELDELVGIPDYSAFRSSGKREYDPITDMGKGFSWWNGINSTKANAERVKQAQALFEKKNPTDPALTATPKCDFNFGQYYKVWYRKSGYTGPCGKPSATCMGQIDWIKATGLKSHPSWYVPLTPGASDSEIQRLLYTQGKGGCLRPCSDDDE
eukprot:TRINITY_DN4731_c0_g1_i1.p1 TRINITY_DN4731_c0_g1~~TRINITY_DN4731_c0_g1_i1.p1  ORF type:complete len:585 (+),score=109.56 TRINITY_DN4731_c0_g1_i1:73-1827(+)